MPTFVVHELTDLPTRAEAESWASIFELDGWSTEIVEEAGGSFTMRARRPADPATNSGGETIALTDGEAAIDVTDGIAGLMSFIGHYESGNNYNAYYKNAGNNNDPTFTRMLLKNVVEWQRNHTEVNGNASSAAGRFQIIRSTLTGLISSLGLNEASEKYNAETQDKMALKLMEGRGLARYQSGDMSIEDFGNNLAKEWAALPVLSRITGHKGIMLNPGQSYYAGDGLNAAHASVEDFRAVLTTVG